MPRLDELLARLPSRHRTALQWFLWHAGTEQPWPGPISTREGDTLLVSKAKGIYKPQWTQYALSIRQTLDGPYPDRDPIVRPDGTWSYAYFQENSDPSARDSEYTNRSLLGCWRDEVPVGVMRQVQGRPDVRYRILGLALVAGWDGGYFLLEGFAPEEQARAQESSGDVELLSRREEQVAIETGAFDPESVTDGRQRVLAQIVRRRGQPEFRRQLIAAYGGHCAISGCDAVEALEAAHILPYRGPATNELSNGLLLRADLHTLFDLGLISIDPTTLEVLIAPSLARSSYAELAGKRIRVPDGPRARPNTQCLALHRSWSGL